MLLSELSGKEIINLHDGAKLGSIGESDIKISPEGKLRQSSSIQEWDTEGFLIRTVKKKAGMWSSPGKPLKK